MEYSKLSERLSLGQPMFALHNKVKDLERAGNKIIKFYLGDPDFNTPLYIKKEIQRAVKDNETHYAPSAGIWKLKIAYADYVKKHYGFKPNLDQLLVTAGANVQLFYALACVCNKGDEIIVSDPSFVSYYSICEMLGINIVRVELKESNNFRLNPKDIKKKISRKTKIVIINSPNNPTGSIIGEQEIKDIFKICEDKNIWLLSDEVYDRINYTDNYYSPSIYDLCKNRVIVVNSFSKTFAMTGWRIGVVMAPKKLVEKMGCMLETTSSCVSPFIQEAAEVAIICEKTHVEKMVKEYKLRMEFMFKRLNEMPGVSCIKPDGAFYLFPNIKKTGLTSKEFSDLMLKNGVALSPGTDFGIYGKGYARLCYCTSMEDIIDGMNIMDRVLKEL